MTCVSKEYEIKTEMQQEERIPLKMLFLLGYNLKLVAYWWGEGWGVRGVVVGIKIWWGESSLGNFF